MLDLKRKISLASIDIERYRKTTREIGRSEKIKHMLEKEKILYRRIDRQKVKKTTKNIE